MVDTVGVGRGGRARDREMPFEEVGFEGRGMQRGVGSRSQLTGFLENALDGGRFGVEAWSTGGTGGRGCPGSCRS